MKNKQGVFEKHGKKIVGSLNIKEDGIYISINYVDVPLIDLIENFNGQDITINVGTMTSDLTE